MGTGPERHLDRDRHYPGHGIRECLYSQPDVVTDIHQDPAGNCDCDHDIRQHHDSDFHLYLDVNIDIDHHCHTNQD